MCRILDRDGVINELIYHQEQEVIDSPFTPGQFKLIPGVTEGIKNSTRTRLSQHSCLQPTGHC